MMHKFRGAYLSGIRQLLREKKLTLSAGQTVAGLRKVLNALYKHKKWNVKVEPGYLHGRGVVKYLSRYLKGGPIRSRQVKATPDGASLRYRDHRSGLFRRQQFTAGRFVRQLPTHVPPHGQPVIRHYGIYASASLYKREIAAEKLPKRHSPFCIEEFLESIGIHRATNCSFFGSVLRVKRIDASERG